MCPKDINNQRLILEAAETEFMEKGFDRARTTEIARRAGVNHAMLHYYFKSKENLFKVVFENKASIMQEILLLNLNGGQPFLDKVKTRVEQHFDFIAANPKMPGVIISEIIQNPKRRAAFSESVKEKAWRVYRNLKQEIDREVKKGTIRAVDPYELISDIVSLNCFFFMTYPLITELLDMDTENILQDRKK